MPLHSARNVVFDVEEPAILDELEGSLGEWMLQDGGFCSEVTNTAREGWKKGAC